MTKRFWETVAEEAGDGSGDLIVVFPEELLEELGWEEGDELEISADTTTQLMTIWKAGNR